MIRYLEIVYLFKVSVDGTVGGVHDEEREGQVEHDEGQRVADVASEHHTKGNNSVRHHANRIYTPNQSHHISITSYTEYICALNHTSKCLKISLIFFILTWITWLSMNQELLSMLQHLATPTKLHQRQSTCTE